MDWQIAAARAAQFPDAMVEHDPIYIRDGAPMASAGVIAGIDLALALLHQRHGTEVTIAAKRLVVIAQRQGGQSQFSPYLVTPQRGIAGPTGPGPCR